MSRQEDLYDVLDAKDNTQQFNLLGEGGGYIYLGVFFPPREIDVEKRLLSAWRNWVAVSITFAVTKLLNPQPWIKSQVSCHHNSGNQSVSHIQHSMFYSFLMSFRLMSLDSCEKCPEKLINFTVYIYVCLINDWFGEVWNSVLYSRGTNKDMLLFLWKVSWDNGESTFQVCLYI